MNKVELIAKVAEAQESTKKAAGEAVEAVMAVITEALVAGEEVKVSGFGTFSITERPERAGRNPLTGEAITIAASKAPKFKAAKALKDAVNV